MLEDTKVWVLLETAGQWEYWLNGENVFRRSVSSWNVEMPDGTPGGVRWECSRAFYDQIRSAFHDTAPQ